MQTLISLLRREQYEYSCFEVKHKFKKVHSNNDVRKMANSTSAATLADMLVSCKRNETFYTIMLAFLPFLLLGITVNILVLIIIWKNKEMRNPTNLLLTNISISDLLFLLVQTPEAIADCFKIAKNGYVRGFYLYQLSWALQDASFISSMLTITLLAGERYKALFYPLQPQRHLQKRGVKIAIGLMWFLAISFGLAHIFDFNVTDDLSQTYIIIWVVLFCVLPTFLTIYFYAKIVIGLCISKTICGQGQRSAEENQSKKRTVKMLILVTVVVAVAKFPFATIYFAFLFVKAKIVCAVELIWPCSCLASSLTPLVYFSLCANYKEGLKRLCQRCCCKVPNAVRSE